MEIPGEKRVMYSSSVDLSSRKILSVYSSLTDSLGLKVVLKAPAGVTIVGDREKMMAAIVAIRVDIVFIKSSFWMLEKRCKGFRMYGLGCMVYGIRFMV